MTYQTDDRLKSFLDTNQLYREQMCRAILATDKRFTNVTPRHPRGGPDGGRDLEATFNDTQKVYGAVGFINTANDSKEQKKVIKTKFTNDLNIAVSSDNKPEVFVFMTNISLTIKEKDQLNEIGKKNGLIACEIFDRERLRIALDTTDGFSIRFQYLGIPLSEAEQASFFAKWGDDIQSVISTGFQKIEDTINRILFFQEASSPIVCFTISLELDREYTGEEIGHFRAFAKLILKEFKESNGGVYSIAFGASDKSRRTMVDMITETTDDKAGLANGISTVQWELKLEDKENDQIKGGDKKLEYEQVGCSSGVGRDTIKNLPISYSNGGFIRLASSLNTLDLDESMFVVIVNKSFAEKINKIFIYCNGYKLKEINSCDFKVDYSEIEPTFPINFSDEELQDPWVSVRPNNGTTCFEFDFFKKTPKREFAHSQL